jgi:hypothetical protein
MEPMTPKKALFGYHFLPFERNPLVIGFDTFDVCTQCELEDDLDLPQMVQSKSSKNFVEESKANFGQNIHGFVKGQVDSFR